MALVDISQVVLVIAAYVLMSLFWQLAQSGKN